MSECAIFKSEGSEGPTKTSLKGSSDKLFDPTVDMMVNDFDDERTLEEEEALAAGEAQDPNAELSSLQKEGDMPLDELLALYGYGHQQESSEAPEPPETVTPVEPEPPAPPSKLQQLYDNIPEGEPEQDASRLLRSVSRVSEEEEEDYDYSPDEDEWKKTIMVGSDYQASIPEGLQHYDDALPYENEDKLLWDPNVIEESLTEGYLRTAANANKKSLLPSGPQLRDDEQALFLLTQCGYNVDEALRRRRINTVQSADTMSLWSEEECRNFEAGLRTYGKNFHLIQQNKVRTRSVGELVQFYYIWKKTERHDVFANKSRLEKKKYTLHPGITDFMDRFLEDQEAARDRSSSPNVQVSVYAETQKKPQTATEQSNLTPKPTEA